MATIKLVRNGTKRNPRRKATKRRRRNGIATAGTTRTVANPRRKRRTRRNGIARARNGFFGDTKRDVKNVAALTGGAVATNVLGNTLATMVAPYLASFGLGNYASIVAQLAIALFGVPYVAKAVAGSDAASMARLGGLLSVTLDLLGTMFPSFASLNPFASSPIVVSGNQIGISPDAVKAIAAASAEDTAAKVSGAMSRIASNAGAGWVQPTQYVGGELVA